MIQVRREEGLIVIVTEGQRKDLGLGCYGWEGGMANPGRKGGCVWFWGEPVG